MLVVDGAGVILSGSYWLPYLLVLVPVMGLATACALTGDLLEERPAVPRLSKVVVGFVALTSVMSLIGFVGWWDPGRTAVEVETGRAIAGAARPGDTLPSSAVAPTSSGPAGCRRPTPTCGRSRCAPWTWATTTSATC